MAFEPLSSLDSELFIEGEKAGFQVTTSRPC
jgi:hypothetical protein